MMRKVSLLSVLTLLWAMAATSCGSRASQSTLAECSVSVLQDCQQSINPLSTKIEFSIFKNGDLIFVADTSAFSSAVIESTDGIFSHVGIIQRVADTLFVLEAIPKEGVVKTAMEKFIADAPKDENGRAAIKVKRLSRLPDQTKDSLQFIADKAVEKALSFIGTPYDFAFLEGVENIYCSELVYESFLHRNEHLFSLIPMNFKDSTGVVSPYWTEYYKKMNLPVPQDWPGTNPNSIFNSALLRDIAF